MNSLLVNNEPQQLYFEESCLKVQKRSIPLHKSSQNKLMQEHIQKYYIGEAPEDIMPQLSELLGGESPMRTSFDICEDADAISDSPLIHTGLICYDGFSTPIHLISPE